jgi:RNA polymerase sigma-70 factor (ECF subfamily)
MMAGTNTLSLDMLATIVETADTSELVRLALAGDDDAFGELVSEHEQFVLRTAWRLVRNNEDARDIAQEAFLRLHRNLRSLKPNRDLAPWLYRVTVNLGLTALRRRKRKPETSLARDDQYPGLSAGRPEQERRSDASDARRTVAALLNELSEKERAAIVLRDLEGLEMGEVAKALGCRQGTVRAHLSRGRLKLRAAIQERGETP